MKKKLTMVLVLMLAAGGVAFADGGQKGDDSTPPGGDVYTSPLCEKYPFLAKLMGIPCGPGCLSRQ